MDPAEPSGEAWLRRSEHADELARAVAEEGRASGLTGRARTLFIRVRNDIECRPRLRQWPSEVRSNSFMAPGWRPRTKTCRSVTVPGVSGPALSLLVVISGRKGNAGRSRWPGFSRAGVADCWEPRSRSANCARSRSRGHDQRRPRLPSTRCRMRIHLRALRTSRGRPSLRLGGPGNRPVKATSTAPEEIAG